MAAPKTGRRSAGSAGSTRSCAGPPRSGSRRMAAVDPADVHYAAVWKPAPGELAAFPNLRVIFNLGAGVDALMADKSLPERAAGARRGRRSHRPHDRICRAACADASPAGALFARQPAREALGSRNPNGRRAPISVGIMGLGTLGADAAEVLRAARLSRRRLEPQPASRSTASNASTARRSSTRSCAAPTSWSACCR